MNEWQVIPEIVGCNAALRRAALKAMETVEAGHPLLIEGETGTGRRPLARCAWARRKPGPRALFTLDCRLFGSEATEEALLGATAATGAPIHSGIKGGVLLLHVEELAHKTQERLLRLIEAQRKRSSGGLQLLMTCAPEDISHEALLPALPGLVQTVRVPALRERIEDIRPITESFLRNASPFERVRCSQAMFEKFCGFDWPGNVTQLRAVLRRMMTLPHGGLLDVGLLAELMFRDDTCYALMQGMPPVQQMPGASMMPSAADGRSLV
jgi:DNA-binding NtrC family response regulator